MVGMERAILPLLATDIFGVESRLAILSFIGSFGLAKALANVFAGAMSDRISRRFVLIAGWLVGLPVPFMIMYAPSWNWIVAANVLLGVNQGLAWSSTVIMKIDLVGPKNRGLAMGLNEAAGYIAVSVAALVSGYLASEYGLRPEPFYPGVVIAVIGLLLSVFLVKDTSGYAKLEASLSVNTESKTFREAFILTSWKNKNLFSVSQAGLINNMNDGVAWGLLPIVFALAGHDIIEIGILAGLYPAVWGLGQLLTGALSDRHGRKPYIVGGMFIQSGGLVLLAATSTLALHACGMILLGLGTAAVYPTLLSAVGDEAEPSWRATAVGVYRLWRDGGYVVGAIVAGTIAQILGLQAAIFAVAALTFVSGVIAAIVMQETLVSPTSPGRGDGPDPDALHV
ncbi:MAG: MFS transporter [Bacteroidetes bacterium]|nr:MAG: MFS transporter [Bacteroidota bacterium]